VNGRQLIVVSNRLPVTCRGLFLGDGVVDGSEGLAAMSRVMRHAWIWW
jgi:hypothetical protein